MNNEIKLLECLWAMCDVNQDIDVAGYNIEFGVKEIKSLSCGSYYLCSLTADFDINVYVIYGVLIDLQIDSVLIINQKMQELLDFFNKHKKEILTNIDEYNDNNDIDFERTRI
jgi:hypothetical protein